MSVLDFIDSDVFTTVYSGDVPMLHNEHVNAICKELMFAVRNREDIFVYGDYDMDGFCSVMVWKEVFNLAGAKPPVVFQYGQRTHQIDRDLVNQVEKTNARVIIICDTGSNQEDHRVLSMLQMRGYTTIVIDHHSFEGDYAIECEHRLTFNAFEERHCLDGCEVSGAYASLLVAKVLCENYLGCALAYNAKVFALASMYSDCVDMSSKLARALYSAVCSTNAKGPVFFSALNKWKYLYGRRLFSFIIAPKLNGCFRTGRFDLLNRALLAENRFQLQDVAEELQEVHKDARTRTKSFIPEFERQRFGDIVFCVHEATEETRLLHIRDFTGVIATQIAEEEKAMVVAVVRDNRMYQGSYRDFYNREMLDTFKLFSLAGGHPPAFGLSFTSLSDFTRHLTLLAGQLETGYEKPYITLNSGVLTSEVDFDALALYNEYMNVKPSVVISHTCKVPKLVRSTSWNKYYDVGLATAKPLMTPRHLLTGAHVLIEPAICRGVELRERI